MVGIQESYLNRILRFALQEIWVTVCLLPKSVFTCVAQMMRFFTLTYARPWHTACGPKTAADMASEFVSIWEMSGSLCEGGA